MTRADQIRRTHDITANPKGSRFIRYRGYGWALFVVVNGRARKVGEARSEMSVRSFLRGGVW